jgi:hypothetical protein
VVFVVGVRPEGEGSPVTLVTILGRRNVPTVDVQVLRLERGPGDDVF